MGTYNIWSEVSLKFRVLFRVQVSISLSLLLVDIVVSELITQSIKKILIVKSKVGTI